MRFSRLLVRFRRLNDRFKRSRHGYILVLAVFIGLLGGFGAVGFRFFIELFRELAWNNREFTLDWIRSLPWYWIVLAPTIGGLLVGTVVRFFAPEVKGHGVPEVMEAVALKNGFIRPRVVAGRVVASGICIASGGSVGREGPIVQIGSALGSLTGQVLGVGTGKMRTLVGCGAAAGMAATFNAPIAGAIFALEVLLGDFGIPNFSPIVIASVTATVVRRLFWEGPEFADLQYTLSHPGELLIYAILGILAAFVALLFVKTLYLSEDLADKVKIPIPLKACLGGALVGFIALGFPQVLGTGYEAMLELLKGEVLLLTLVLLLLVKILAVSITIASGGSGGVFAPSLFIGATLGALVGSLAKLLFGLTTPIGAYALVGMGAVVAATTNAPITAILILFEITNDYRIILPLMMACILATVFFSRLSLGNIYTTKLLRRGVNLRDGQDIDILKTVKVREVLRTDVSIVEPGERLLGLLSRMGETEDHSLYVVDPDRNLMGIISMTELQTVLKDIEILKDVLIAAEIAETHWPPISEDDTLDKVLAWLDVSYREELPVLDGDKLLGCIKTEDVISRYNRELFHREMVRNLEEE